MTFNGWSGGRAGLGSAALVRGGSQVAQPCDWADGCGSKCLGKLVLGGMVGGIGDES